MSDTPRQIVGTFKVPTGSAYPNETLTWFRNPRSTGAQGSSVIADEIVRILTDASGKIDDFLLAGDYLVMIRLEDADRYFRCVVPDTEGPHDVSTLVGDYPQHGIIEAVLRAGPDAIAAAESAEIASTARDQSVSAAVESSASKSSAESYAGIATDAKDAAQAAAVAAGASIFATTADGIAATSNGDIFYVAELNSLSVYKNSAGTADFVLSLFEPVFASLAEFKSAVAAGYEAQPGMMVLADGVFYSASPNARSVTGLPGWEVVIDGGSPSPHGSTSPAGRLGSAKSLPEAWGALGLEPRIISVTGDGDAIIANADNFYPAVHFVEPTATGTINVDLSGLAIGRTYRFVNSGSFGGVVSLNVDGNKGMLGDWLSTNTTVKSFNLIAGESVDVVRMDTTSFFAKKAESGLWVPYGTISVKREKDGKYDIIYRRTSSISGLAESTANNIPTGFNLNDAYVVSVSLQPRTDGGAHPDFLPQVTKMGANHSLSNTQFAIRNPNAAAIQQPILIHLKNVSGVMP